MRAVKKINNNVAVCIDGNGNQLLEEVADPVFSSGMLG